MTLIPTLTPAQVAAQVDAGAIFADADQPARLALALLAHATDHAAMARIRRAALEGEPLADAVAVELAELAARAAYLHRLLADAYDPSLMGTPLDMLEDRRDLAIQTARDVAAALRCRETSVRWSS
jgi:hypothetical protein